MHKRGERDDGQRRRAETWQDDLEAIAIRRLRRSMTTGQEQGGRA